MLLIYEEQQTKWTGVILEWSSQNQTLNPNENMW